MFKKLVERLAIMGITDKKNESEQGTPYFTQTKGETSSTIYW